MQVKHTIKLRHKILLVIAATSFIAVAAIGLSMTNSIIRDNRYNELQKNAVSLNAAKDAIQTNLDSINISAMTFAMNPYVSEIMTDGFDRKSNEDQQSVIHKVGQLIYDNSYRALFKTGFSVILGCNDGRVYGNPRSSIICIDSEDTINAVNKLKSDGQHYSYKICPNTVFNGSNQSNAIYVKEFSLNYNNNQSGMVIQIIPREMLTNAFETVIDREWVILDKDSLIIESNNPDFIGKNALDVYNYDLKIDDYVETSGYISQGRNLISYIHDERNNLTYLIITPLEIITKSLGNIKGTIIGVSIALIIVLLLFSWYLSKRFTQPLDKVVRIMGKAEQGDLSVRVNSKTDDEIGVIGISLDTMIEKLQKSIDEIKRVEQENRKAEMKIMELQLKPHFLYNTLSSIIWLANENKNAEVIDIAKSLAMFYRISLSDGRGEIRVSEEVENVKNYVRIQNYRYQDKFMFSCDIDINTYDCLVPKLILQPLVENSINYGMKPKSGNDGVIGIKVYIEENQLKLEVFDNGDEVTPDDIDEINRRLKNGTSGIGTGNVYRRIAHYGHEYRLFFEKSDGMTVAKINLPIRKGVSDESSSDSR